MHGGTGGCGGGVARPRCVSFKVGQSRGQGGRGRKHPPPPLALQLSAKPSPVVRREECGPIQGMQPSSCGMPYIELGTAAGAGRAGRLALPPCSLGAAALTRDGAWAPDTWCWVRPPGCLTWEAEQLPGEGLCLQPQPLCPGQLLGARVGTMGLLSGGHACADSHALWTEGTFNTGGVARTPAWRPEVWAALPRPWVPAGSLKDDATWFPLA